MRVQHVKLSTYGVDSWDATVLLDGRAKDTGARGVRAVRFDGRLVFGASGYSIELYGVLDLHYDGGIYAAGGTSPYSGGVRSPIRQPCHQAALCSSAIHLDI
jgi:hypothetical protein